MEWERLPNSAEPLKCIYGVDGSYQTINLQASIPIYFFCKNCFDKNGR